MQLTSRFLLAPSKSPFISPTNSVHIPIERHVFSLSSWNDRMSSSRREVEDRYVWAVLNELEPEDEGSILSSVLVSSVTSLGQSAFSPFVYDCLEAPTLSDQCELI